MIGSSNLPGQLQTLFTVVLHITSDTWKRFVHDHGTYQCKLLCLAACTSLSEFVVLWDQYQEARAMCPTCMDSAFSERLLSGFPKELAKQPLEIQESTYNTVVSILDDLCMHCPVGTDPVEVKNGQIQHIASRRGRVACKGPIAAKESSYLMAAVRAFELQKHWVLEHTVPKKKTTAEIMKHSGRSLPTACNQHSASLGKKRLCSSAEPWPGPACCWPAANHCSYSTPPHDE